jgi:protein-S-isoprenylcysteine O-methyltransferase Ste14
MTKDMTAIGAEKKIAAITLPCLGIACSAGIIFPERFKIGCLSIPLLFGSGLGLIVVGLSLYGTAAIMMLRAFRRGRLETRGPFAISRNPMYASFMALLLPGLALALNNWLILAAIAALCAATNHFVKEEERRLELKFGPLWKDYAARVGRFFPKPW